MPPPAPADAATAATAAAATCPGQVHLFELSFLFAAALPPASYTPRGLRVLCGTGMQILTYFGGLWFSTTDRGQCAEGHAPRDGSGCSWRQLAPGDFVNASCVADRLFAIIRAANPPCFAACEPDNDHPGTPCFTNCVKTTIMGANGTTGIDPNPLVAAFAGSFDASTGCPPVDVEALRRTERARDAGGRTSWW